MKSTNQPDQNNQQANQPAAPWEQQPGESTAAYAMATAYFELGPLRSLARVAHIFGKSPGTIGGYSRRYGWVARARAYDQYRAMVSPQQHTAAPTNQGGLESCRWAERVREGREVEWEVWRSLVARIQEMLSTPLEDRPWSARDLDIYCRLATSLMRQAAGEALAESTTAESREQELTVRVEYVMGDAPSCANDAPPSAEQPENEEG